MFRIGSGTSFALFDFKVTGYKKQILFSPNKNQLILWRDEFNPSASFLSLQSRLAQGVNKPLFIRFIFVCYFFLELFERELGTYSKHFSGFNPGFLLPS